MSERIDYLPNILAERLEMTRSYLRCHGHQIRRLGMIGDKEALLLESTYRRWWKTPTDTNLQQELVHVWEEFVKRDLDKDERAILQNRYGYKVDNE